MSHCLAWGKSIRDLRLVCTRLRANWRGRLALRQSNGPGNLTDPIVDYVYRDTAKWPPTTTTTLLRCVRPFVSPQAPCFSRSSPRQSRCGDVSKARAATRRGADVTGQWTIVVRSTASAICKCIGQASSKGPASGTITGPRQKRNGLSSRIPRLPI